ncbi:hypothetical protein E4U54_006524, partial [Claviceps lovelessii]
FCPIRSRAKTIPRKPESSRFHMLDTPATIPTHPMASNVAITRAFQPSPALVCSFAVSERAARPQNDMPIKRPSITWMNLNPYPCLTWHRQSNT